MPQPEHLKPYKFKKGNDLAKQGNGSGRPRSPRNYEIEDLALEKVRGWFGNALEKVLVEDGDDSTGMEKAFEHIVRRAFLDENKKTGLQGDVSYVKLFMQYMFGKPASKIEMSHTNTVDLFRAMMEQQAKDMEEEYIDVEVSSD